MPATLKRRDDYGSVILETHATYKQAAESLREHERLDPWGRYYVAISGKATAGQNSPESDSSELHSYGQRYYGGKTCIR